MSQQKGREIGHTDTSTTSTKELVSFVFVTILLFRDKEDRNTWQKPPLLISMYVS
jgi:hypothetical protein